MFKACLQSLIMLNMQSTVKLHFFGTFPYRMAALERTHYQGADVIAGLGLVMAAARGTPAPGPWIGLSTIELWF